MRSILIALFAAALLVSCSGGPVDSGSAVRVHIRENGNIVTTYDLNAGGQVTRSATRDGWGAAVTRSYSYDARNELSAVTRMTAGAGSKTLYVERSNGAPTADRPTAEAKATVSDRGGGDRMIIRYYYSADGTLDGITQTDQYGNVQAKAAHDEEAP